MKYIVVEIWTTPCDEDCGISHAETKVHLKDTLEDVRKSLDIISSNHREWAVYEVVDGHAVRRSVTFQSTVTLS